MCDVDDAELIVIICCKILLARTMIFVMGRCGGYDCNAVNVSVDCLHGGGERVARFIARVCERLGAMLLKACFTERMQRAERVHWLHMLPFPELWRVNSSDRVLQLPRIQSRPSSSQRPLTLDPTPVKCWSVQVAHEKGRKQKADTN